MQKIEQPKGPSYNNYIDNARSSEEVLFDVLKDYVAGKLTGDDLRTMADMYCNTFPPFEYFNKRSGTEEFIREQVAKATNSAEFAQTELFQDIMTASTVVDRFKKASPNVIGLTGNHDYPTYWPQEYRTGSPAKQEGGWAVEAKKENVTNWRTKLKGLFGLN